MTTYTLNTNAQQDQALAWLLAQQQAVDPAGAPVDVATLMSNLMRDRLVDIRRQHLVAITTVTDLKAKLDTVDPETIRKVKTALGY